MTEEVKLTKVSPSCFHADVSRGLPQISATHRAPPTTCDGSTPWKDYLVNLELTAELNEWDDHCRSLQLAASLRGPEQAVLADSEPVRRRKEMP